MSTAKRLEAKYQKYLALHPEVAKIVDEFEMDYAEERGHPPFKEPTKLNTTQHVKKEADVLPDGMLALLMMKQRDICIGLHAQAQRHCEQMLYACAHDYRFHMDY